MFSTPQSLKIGALLVFGSILGGAAPIGTIGFGGQIEVTFSTLDYTPFTMGAGINGTGRITILGDGDGIFENLSQFKALNGATIVDRDVLAGVVPSQRADADINVPGWLKFDDPAFEYVLDLRYISLGTYNSGCGGVAAAGQTCTPVVPAPYQSPYNLSNFIDSKGRISSSASLAMSGVLRHKVTGNDEYQFNAVIGAEFYGKSYQSVLNEIATRGRVVASYSGTLEVTAIPEPASAWMGGIGFALLAGSMMLRRQSR